MELTLLSFLYSTDMERLLQEIRSLRGDAERLQQAHRLVTELDVLLLGLSLFRSDIEKLQRVIRSVSIKYVISVYF